MVYGQKKSIDDGLKSKKSNFKRLFPGFKKKAIQLSILCDKPVGFIVYGPDNLHVWPEPQENPKAISEIVEKFNSMNEQKRKNNSCDLYDFPNLKGLSVDELKIHLAKIDSHLLEISRRKIAILNNTAMSSDQKLKAVMMSSEDDEKMGGNKLGFGGGLFDEFDELGKVVCGSTSISNFESQFAIWDSESPLVTLPHPTTNTSLSNTSF